MVLTRKPASFDFYPLPSGVDRVVEPLDMPWMRWLGPLAFPLRVLRLQSWLDEQNVGLAIGVTSLPAISCWLRRGCWEFLVWCLNATTLL